LNRLYYEYYHNNYVNLIKKLDTIYKSINQVIKKDIDRTILGELALSFNNDIRVIYSIDKNTNT